MNFLKRKVKSEVWKGAKSFLTTTWTLRALFAMLSVISTNIANTETVYAVDGNPIDFAETEETDETETTIIPMATEPIGTTQKSVTTEPITTKVIPVTTITSMTTVTTSEKEDNSTETQTEIEEEFVEEYIEDEVVYEENVVEEETEVVSENEPVEVEECTIEGEPEYMSDEYMLAYAMAREAADYQDAEYVGSVILNRVADWEFPDTVIGVLEDSRFCKQYSWAYGYYPREDIYDDYFFEIARKLLNEGSSLPQGVIFQSQLVLGEIYLQYGVHYYCFR